MNLIQRGLLYLSIIVFLLGTLVSCSEFSDDEPFPEIYTTTLFISSNNGIVYAIDPESGKYKWKFSVQDEVFATPVIYDNAVWIATTGGTLYKLDKQYGKELGKRVFEYHISGTPIGYGGNTLFVPCGNNLHAINVSDLSDLWVVDAKGLLRSSPTIHTIDGHDGDFLFLSTMANDVRAYNVENGEQLWQYTPAEMGSFYSSPCVSNDSFLFIGNDNGKVYAVNTFDGTEKWSFQTQGNVQSSPIHIGGNVLVGSNDRNFYSVDSATGLLRWKIQTNDRVISSPCVYNQNVYFGSFDNFLYCVDIIDGEVKWKFQTFGLIKASPIEYKGEIYITSFDKNLYRVDAEDGKATWFFNVNGQMEASPVIDAIDRVIVPSISGDYMY